MLIGLGVAWWRLSQGPVELNFIREHVQAELSEARSGRPVGLDRVELAWSQAGNALELRAVGVTVEDGTGGVLSRSEEARIELGILPLLVGRIEVVRADFSGGEISITRKLDGEVHVAFGPPGSPADIIIPAPPEGENLEQRVARLLDGMEAAFRPVGPGGKLKSISVRDANLSIVDDAGGGRWTADASSFELARQGNALVLTASARLEGAEGLAPANLRVTTDTGFQAAIVEFGAESVRPRALFSPAALGPFAGLDAPLTATVTIGLDRRVGINRIEGDATLGRGTADMAGGRFDLDGGRLHGRYDLDSDELVIDQLQLAGDRTRINGEVRVRDASAILRAQEGEPAPFNIALPSMTLDLPGVFGEPINFTNVQAVGTIVSSERSIRFTQLNATTGEARVNVAGRIYWGEAGGRTYTGIELDGGIDGATDVRTVLAGWPLPLGESARDYLGRSLVAGRVTNVRARLDIRPSDFAADAFRNEAVDVRFDVTNGEFRFIDTMSPIVQARGEGHLRGNGFFMTVPEARLNNLMLSNGRIEIPRFKPRGSGMATISARAEGEARNIMEVLMQEPLALSDRLPVDIASVTGRGAVNVRLQRPMLDEVAFEDWRFSVDGDITNFAGAMSTRRVALANGQLRVTGDQSAIRVAGPIRAGTSDVEIQWTEHLNRQGRASSEYQIAGNFDADDLERLGYPVAQYAQGRVGVTVSGEGRGFDVDQATIELDLRQAAVEAPRQFWTKRAGQAASARFAVARQADGGLVFNNIEARGAGLVAQGRVRLGRDERIAEADITRLAIEGRSDARINAVRASDGGLDVQVRGALFDAAPFMGAAEPQAARAQGAPTVIEPPLRASVIVDRLKMRGGATLSDARVELATYRGALATLSAEGRSPGDRPFSLALGPRPSDPSGRIRLRSEDAGFTTRALTGAENLVGGTVTAEGDWRSGPPSTARFDVHLRNFQVVRMPALARLLSSVGSLSGLAEALNGEGIGFTALDAPVVYANDRITFQEARMAGPSLGLTGSGSYDINADNMDVDGVVVPWYGLNSFLGAVPIVGDIFVSRRGEGVFGMTYALNGQAAAPRVSVNPVSIITPGILRRIFEPVSARQQNGGAHALTPEAAPAEAQADPAPPPEPVPPPAPPRTAQEGAAPAVRETAALPAGEAP